MASHVKQETLLGLIGASKTACFLCLQWCNYNMSGSMTREIELLSITGHLHPRRLEGTSLKSIKGKHLLRLPLCHWHSWHILRTWCHAVPTLEQQHKVPQGEGIERLHYVTALVTITSGEVARHQARRQVIYIVSLP